RGWRGGGEPLRRSSARSSVARSAEVDVRRERLALLPRAREVLHERARVEDAQRLHLERADAVLRREHRLAPLHGALVRVVRRRLGLRVEERVVVAAPELEVDPPRDVLGHATDQPLLEEVRLGLVPAALVEEPAEAAAEELVLLGRV